MTAALPLADRISQLLPEHRLPLFAYGAFVGCAIVLLHPTFADMVNLWLHSSSYSHGLAVAPAALWMIYRTGTPEALRMDWRPLVMVAGAGMFWAAAHAAHVALFEQIAFVSLLIAGVGVFFGLSALRAWAFPLLFLYFMVPFGEALLPYLQTLTANAAIVLLNLVGIVTYLDGYLIETPAGFFEVAEACAGLRFLLAAIMLAALFAYTTLPTIRLRLIFLTIAIAIAIAGNIIRTFLLILIATLTDMRWAVGADHLAIGFVFYGLVLLILFWIGSRMAPRDLDEDPKWRDVTTARFRPAILAGAVGLIVLTATYAATVIDRHPARSGRIAPPLLSASGWRILPPPENWTPEFPGADAIRGATYHRDDTFVYFSNGVVTHERRDHEIVNTRNRPYDGKYWRKIGEIEAPITLFGETRPRNVEILAGPERRRLAVISGVWWRGKLYHSEYALKRDVMIAKLRGKNAAGGVFFIATNFKTDPETALVALRRFAADAEPAKLWLAREQ